MPKLDGEVFVRMPKKEVQYYRNLYGKNFSEMVRQAIRKHLGDEIKPVKRRAS